MGEDMELKPIETAPKDGFCFLGCTSNGAIQIIKHSKHLGIWVDPAGRESYQTVAYWMLLPEAPNVKLSAAALNKD